MKYQGNHQNDLELHIEICDQIHQGFPLSVESLVKHKFYTIRAIANILSKRKSKLLK